MSEHVVIHEDVLSRSSAAGCDLSGAPSPCVYFLIDGSDIVYIGRTSNLKSRIPKHKSKAFDRIYWIGTDSLSTEVAESDNINHHMPILNKRIPCTESIISRGVRKESSQVKYIQAGLSGDLFKKFEAMRSREERTTAKMGEILIREAIAARELLAQGARK